MEKIIFRRVGRPIKQIRDASFMNKVGNFMRRLIVNRTQKQGRGINKQGGRIVKLRKLEPSTIESRKRARKRGELSNLTTPKKSNLTATGQMLFEVAVTAVTKGAVAIGFLSDRSEKIAGYHEKGVGPKKTKRKFLGLSAGEERKVTEFVEKQLRRLSR